jgi:hypothetical protein
MATAKLEMRVHLVPLSIDDGEPLRNATLRFDGGPAADEVFGLLKQSFSSPELEVIVDGNSNSPLDRLPVAAKES